MTIQTYVLTLEQGFQALKLSENKLELIMTLEPQNSMVKVKIL